MPAVRRNASLIVGWRIHRALYRLTGGRIGSRVGRLAVLLLTTRGRHSGEARDVTLNYFEDDGAAVVVGSNAGDDRHPAWYLNLLAAPEVEVTRGGRRSRVRARVTEGVERERLWKRLVALDPSYAEYPRRTSREIPVVVLEPRDRATQAT